ncbi:MAG: hypothetical protein ABJ327_05150 [Litoreibacter sp.]
MSKFYKLFNHGFSARKQMKKGEPAPAALDNDEGTKATFLTPQTLITFPGATAAIVIVWQSVEALLPKLQDSIWVPFVISAVVGLFIFIIGVSDPDSKMSKRDITIGFLVSIINVFYLFGSATGISAVTGLNG